ncbi:MAG TPA: hypothetical protein VGT79_07765 [Xanthomonadaceae bacterium]|nr:hypothetical protein [Xanthomonadaceae bacterium]
MPSLVPISNPETPALLALRRTLWQLAFVGIVAAAVLARIAPDSGALASWCVLVPLSALAVHFRQALLNLLQSHRGARRSIVSRRRQPSQARRAGDGDRSNTRRPPRLRSLRVSSQVRPLTR